MFLPKRTVRQKHICYFSIAHLGCGVNMRLPFLLAAMMLSSSAHTLKPIQSYMDMKPELQLHDAYDVEKARAAFAEAPPELFRTVLKRKVITDPEVRYMATPVHQARSSVNYTPKKGEAFMVRWFQKQLALWIPTEEFAEPGLKLMLWGVNGTVLVLVSEDGAVYQTEASMLSTQPADPAIKNRWHSLTVEDIGWLEGKGMLEKGTAATITNALIAGNECAVKVQDKAEPEFRQIEAANITDSTRQNRFRQLQDSLSTRIEKTCKAKRDAFDKLVKTLVEARFATKHR